MKRIIRSVLALALVSHLSMPSQAQAHNDLLPFLFGLTAGVVVGVALSQRDQVAMSGAYPGVYGQNVYDGYRIPFEGDRHGYYEVVNEGFYGPNRVYCRQIRTMVLDQFGHPVQGFERPHLECVEQNQWVQRRNFEMNLYVVQPRPRPVLYGAAPVYGPSPRPPPPIYQVPGGQRPPSVLPAQKQVPQPWYYGQGQAPLRPPGTLPYNQVPVTR